MYAWCMYKIMHACICHNVCRCTCTQTYNYEYVYMLTTICVCMCVYACVCVRRPMCACTYVCTYVCVYRGLGSSSTHVHQVLTHQVQVQCTVHHNTRGNFNIYLETVFHFITGHECIIKCIIRRTSCLSYHSNQPPLV